MPEAMRGLGVADATIFFPWVLKTLIDGLVFDLEVLG